MSWGPPQGQQGYPPQPGYAYPHQQQQQQQQQPQPPKKGMGVGAILAIVGGISLLLLVVCGGLAAYFLYRSDSGSSASSSSASVNADHSDALKTKSEALLTAVKTGKAKEVEGPLLELACTPESAKAWFTSTFDQKTGDDLYGYWDRQVFPNITELAKTFKKANEYERTEVHVTRFASKADVDACQTAFCKYRDNGNLAKVYGAMKKPVPLYVVTLTKPGSTPGLDDEDVFFFAEISGSFAYVGELLIM